jgi:hypothetical protein
MLYVVIGEAKPNVTLAEIQTNRQAYVEWEQRSLYAGKYRTLNRYEVVGLSPKKSFWIMECEEPTVIHGLLEFFGDVWNVTAYPVIERTIANAAKSEMT